MNATFTLRTESERQGDQTWRLKEGQIRFRGTKSYQNLVVQRVPASIEQIQQFSDAMDLLDVWRWRPNYHSEEAGWRVLDGGTWSFKAEFHGRIICCEGEEGYPSFGDPLQVSINLSRFGLLIAAMYDVFAIEPLIAKARKMADHEQNLARKDSSSESQQSDV